MEKEYKTFLSIERGEDIHDMDIEDYKGFQFISTPSHGFLIVPVTSLYYNLAMKIQKADGYGYYIPNKAVFLEEDCQAGVFLNKLPQGVAISAQ